MPFSITTSGKVPVPTSERRVARIADIRLEERETRVGKRQYVVFVLQAPDGEEYQVMLHLSTHTRSLYLMFLDALASLLQLSREQLVEWINQGGEGLDSIWFAWQEKEVSFGPSSDGEHITATRMFPVAVVEEVIVRPPDQHDVALLANLVDDPLRLPDPETELLLRAGMLGDQVLIERLSGKGKEYLNWLSNLGVLEYDGQKWVTTEVALKYIAEATGE